MNKFNIRDLLKSLFDNFLQVVSGCISLLCFCGHGLNFVTEEQHHVGHYIRGYLY